jgi:hypothetical protein
MNLICKYTIHLFRKERLTKISKGHNKLMYHYDITLYSEGFLILT